MLRPMPALERSLASVEVETAARAWVESMIKGAAISTLEEQRLKLLRRGGDIAKTEWEDIVARVVEDYIGAPDLQRAFVHSAIVRVLSTAAELLESEHIEPHHRVAAGRLALEAAKNLASLVGVQQPERVEIDVVVSAETHQDRLSAILAKVDATIIEAKAIEVAGVMDDAPEEISEIG